MPPVRPGSREISYRTPVPIAERDSRLPLAREQTGSDAATRAPRLERTSEATRLHAADPLAGSTRGVSLRVGIPLAKPALDLRALNPILPFHFKRDEAVVSPTLSRGSQPSAQDLAALKAKGIKAVVNLRVEDNSDQANTQALNLTYLRIPMVDNTVPTPVQVKTFLDFATAPQHQPVFVHCTAGAGRTGVMVAAYRMAVEGWEPKAAIDEALKYQLHVVDQEKFLIQFAQDLAAHKYPDYPKIARP